MALWSVELSHARDPSARIVVVPERHGTTDQCFERRAEDGPDSERSVRAVERAVSFVCE